MDVDDLVRLARRRGARGTEATVLKDARSLVIRVGDVAVKAHPAGTDEAALRARLDVAARAPDLLLPPLGLERLSERLGERLVSFWPAGDPVTPGDLGEDGFGEFWAAGGRLLARLHALPYEGLPEAGGPARLRGAMAELDAEAGRRGQRAHADLSRAFEVIRAAYETLPEQWGPAWGLAHGDWHLGQLLRHRGRWVLIDPDDLGGGDPAWDLARPAAWFASGLLEPAVWDSFLSAYAQAGGTAVTPEDPWRELDSPARALTVQLAATAVTAASRAGDALDDVAGAMISSCGRIAKETIADAVSQVPRHDADLRPSRRSHRPV